MKKELLIAITLIILGISVTMLSVAFLLHISNSAPKTCTACGNTLYCDMCGELQEDSHVK